MKTQYYTAVSLDGFIADEQHSLSWLLQFKEDAGSYGPFIREVGAVAMGANTYQWILNHHAATKPGEPLRWEYEQPAWVFTSRQFEPVPGADIRFVKGDVAPIHRQMVDAAGGKNVWLVGGGELVAQFHDAGLLDELIVTVASVTLGSGFPLLPRRIVEPPLELLSVRQVGSAFAELVYRVPGGPEGPRGPAGSERATTARQPDGL